jgi:ribosomal protein S13
MALSWIVSNGKDVKSNFARTSPADTLLVDGFYPPFVQAIEAFFNNTPKVKDFQYVINWRLDGGVRSVEKQSSLSPSATGARGGQSAHNYGMAIDFAPVGLENGRRTNAYRSVVIGAPYTAHQGALAEPWAVAVEALYNHPTLRSGATFPKLNDYNHIEWRDYRDIAKAVAPQYWTGIGAGNRRSTTTPRTLSAPVSTPRGPGVSPFISANESFHPHIQYELTRRRNAAETANSYMPYIKLTSLVNVYNANLETNGPSGSFGAWCPSLGIHNQTVTTFDSIYNPEEGRSIVGYATTQTRGTDGNPRLTTIPVVVESSEEDPPNIPPPGILSMNAERTTAGGFGIRGGLFKATVNIRAYSLGQVNTLLKYFIRQGTKVVLEIGRESSSAAENILTNSTELSGFRAGQDGGLTNLKTTTVRELFQKFNWIRSEEDIKNELGKVVIAQEGQRELIEKYTYNNFGNYELFIGYVASFKMKYTKDNVYDIELTVHSVQQFEVPTRLGGTRSSPSAEITVPNTCEAIDIMDYFKPESGYRDNSFLQVLASCVKPDTPLNGVWGTHVIPLSSTGVQAGSGGVKSNGYLISWKCFVDLILNDETYGILGTFQLRPGVDDKTLALLRSGLLSRIQSAPLGRPQDINSNEVSWNQYLRSTDPNVMIIYNRTSQAPRRENYAAEVLELLKGAGELSETDLNNIQTALTGNPNTANDDVRAKIENNTEVGSFDSIGGNVSSLTKGVWINTNAIIDAFSSADTITAGITALLNNMNNATQGYWNLQVLSGEPEIVGLRVIDAGLSKPVRAPLVPQTGDFTAALPTSSPTELVDRLKADVAKFANPDGTPQFLYVFNRKLQRLASSDLGSELLDINIDASMPNVIAIQAIAGVGGVAQRGVLASINVDELKAISMFDTYPSSSQQTNTCADRPPAMADKNKNNTLNEDQINRITAAVTAPSKTSEYFWRFWKTDGVDGVLATIEEEAFKKWKDDNKAALDAKSITESDGRSKVKDDIETIRKIPAEIYERNNPGMLGLVREYAVSFGQAIDLIENDVSKIVELLNKNKKDEEIHPFNVSNLTKTIVDLTIPGIGGILLFQAFSVDRVPNILRRGYYVVTKVAHEFSVDNGWITKIQGRFRFKPNMQGDART